MTIKQLILANKIVGALSVLAAIIITLFALPLIYENHGVTGAVFAGIFCVAMVVSGAYNMYIGFRHKR